MHRQNMACPYSKFIHCVALDKSSFFKPHLQSLAMRQLIRLAIFITKQILNVDIPYRQASHMKLA